MNTNESNLHPVPVWFWILSGIALLWNLMGLAVYCLSLTFNREALEKTEFTPEQIDLILATPLWVNIAFGIAVVCGTLGCVGLLMRKKWAVPVLVLSLLGVIAQNTYMYLLSDTVKLMGVGLSPVVIPVAIAMVPFAMFCAKKGWLR